MRKLIITHPVYSTIRQDLIFKNLTYLVNPLSTKLLRMLMLVLAPLCMVAFTALAQKPAASLEQIRNGSSAGPTDPAQWQNGNAGNQTAHYVEGHSIGYRALITNVAAGQTVILTLGYDITHSSKNAIDFLTHYDRLQPHGQFFHTQETVDPRLGTSFAGSTVVPSTKEIPQPYLGTSAGAPAVRAYNAIESAKKVMTMWGGTIDGIAYVTPFANTSLAQAEQQINVTFTMGSSGSAVLAWGGHIASRLDWGSTTAGVPLSAGGISGSPYHMRLIGWSIGNLGQQDRSLSAAAVIAPPGCALTGANAVCAGSENTYATTEVADSYSWTLINNTSEASFKTTPTSTSNSVIVLAGTTTGNYTVKLVTTRNGITSTDICEIQAAVTKPIAPAVIYNPPACHESTFSITVGSATNPIVAGATYTVVNKLGENITGISPASPYTAPNPAPATITFSNIPAGAGFQVTVTINGCLSTANTCGTTISSGIQGPAPAKAPANSELTGRTEKELTAYPIPFFDKTTLEFKSLKNEDYVINLYDLKGTLIKQLKTGKAKAGDITKVEVNGNGMAESIYLVRKVTKSGVSTVKLLKRK